MVSFAVRRQQQNPYSLSRPRGLRSIRPSQLQPSPDLKPSCVLIYGPSSPPAEGVKSTADRECATIIGSVTVEQDGLFEPVTRERDTKRNPSQPFLRSVCSTRALIVVRY